MSQDFSNSKASFILLFTTLSLLGGIINGLLGTGGGIILVYLYGMCAKRGFIASDDRFAFAMMTILPVSVISLFTYSSEYLKDITYLTKLIPASAAGGILGAYLSTRIKPFILEKVFAALVIYSGIRMIF